MKHRPRCPECGAFVNRDGSHRADTFTECSRRNRISADVIGGKTHWDVGNKTTAGWENRVGGK